MEIVHKKTDMQGEIKIALVDDHKLFRRGLCELLSAYPFINVLFEAGSGKELLESLRTSSPDIIILDIEMPEMDGVQAATLVKKKYPDCRILMLSMHDETEMIYHLVQRGVNGFLNKNSEVELLVTAIKTIFEDGYYFDDRVARVMAKGISARLPRPVFTTPVLSSREVEVIRLMCKQHTIREIAGILNISPRTVDTYRDNIYTKTASRNIAGVVMYAIRYNLLEESC